MSAAGCVFHRVAIQPVVPTDQTVIVGPVKAHLSDGSTVVYAPGVIVTVTGQMLHGVGMRYNYAASEATRVESVPVEMVVGMERFMTTVNRPATIAGSVGASYLITMLSLLALYAITYRD